MSENVAFLDGGKTTAQGAGKATTPMFSGVGILDDTDLAVAQNGTPNNTVLVAAGRAVIGYNSPSAGAEADHHFVWNTANKSVTITANASGNPRVDSIVAYVDVTAYAASDNAGALKFIAVAGTAAASPVAPSDSTIQTAVGGAGVPWILLAQIAVANGFSSIVTANITDARPKSSVMRRILDAAVADFVLSGGVWSQTSGLIGGMTMCLALVDGELVSKPAMSKTFTASKDTYVDLPKTAKPTINADLTFTEVTNGAASPSLASGSIRLAKVVTNGSAITSVTTSGKDSLGNYIRNLSPVTSAQIAEFDKVRVENSGSESLSNNSETNITWDTETFDTNNLHSTSANTDRLTAAITGKYLCDLTVFFAANGTGIRDISIVKSDGVIVATCTAQPNGSSDLKMGCMGVISLTAGDYVVAKAYQNSGGSLNIVTSRSHFGITLLP